jgi:hypothetical protein
VKKTMMRDIETYPKEKILDVNYRHLTFDDGDEMFITDQGLAVWQNLLPENFWKDKAWFLAHSEKQPGSGSIYKITTKPAAGEYLDIIMKWNRMGEDIPGQTDETGFLTDARFLSPFEEFQFLQELKEGLQYAHMKLELQSPLAIYVPSSKEDYTRLGRRKYLMDFIRKRHENDVEIDIERSYAVIYQWIEGINIAQAHKQGFINEQDIGDLTRKAAAEVSDNGFVVRDHKADHIIVKPIGTNLLRDGESNIVYGYVDYELLERTPERDKIIRKKRRHGYLVKMPKRFEDYPIAELPLKPMGIFHVPYLYGEVPSSKGRLWVVGNDPSLFDYFLPEKWRKLERTKLSLYHDIYHKVSRDDIHLVLKVSKVGEQPDVDPFNDRERKILEYGFNSPFEEISLALELNSKEIPTIYPRAIYMTGSKSKISDCYRDDSRYTSHADMLVPDKNEPILKKDHEYIIIWGYWNGTDEMLANYDGNYYTAINALSAYRQHFITKTAYFRLMETVRNRMLAVGVEDLNLRGTHILLSINSANEIVTDEAGLPKTRICNFELLKRIGT